MPLDGCYICSIYPNRIAGVYWKYSDSLSQLSCQNLMTIGYCSPHFSSDLRRSLSADSLFTA